MVNCNAQPDREKAGAGRYGKRTPAPGWTCGAGMPQLMNFEDDNRDDPGFDVA